VCRLRPACAIEIDPDPVDPGRLEIPEQRPAQ